MLIEADIAPEVRVLETGVGSGALSMALLRAGADVVGYELRDDFAERARSNVGAMLGTALAIGWRSAMSMTASTNRGWTGFSWTFPNRGGSCPTPSSPCDPAGSSAPTSPRSTRRRNFVRPWKTTDFGMASTLEVLHRTWHIEARSVRPDHRMVGHTGFITTARLLIPYDLWWDRPPKGEARSAGDSALLDEDALARALLGGLDHRVFEVFGYRQPCRRSRPVRSSRRHRP